MNPASSFVLLDSRRGVHEVVKVGWARVKPGTGAERREPLGGRALRCAQPRAHRERGRKPCIMLSDYDNTCEICNGRV
jgi:hypothetical protein